MDIPEYDLTLEPPDHTEASLRRVNPTSESLPPVLNLEKKSTELTPAQKENLTKLSNFTPEQISNLSLIAERLTPEHLSELAFVAEIFTGESSKLGNKATVEEIRAYGKLRAEISRLELKATQTFGDMIDKAGLSLQTGALEKTPVWAKAALAALIAGGLLFTAYETKGAVDTSGVIPVKLNDLMNALVSFNPGLIDAGKVLPSLDLPKGLFDWSKGLNLKWDFPSAFNPMFSARQQAVDIASKALNEQVGQTVNHAVHAVEGGLATTLAVFADPIGKTKKIIGLSGKGISAISRAISAAERTGGAHGK